MIARVIKQRTRTTPPTPAAVSEFLLHACEEEKDNVFDAMATHHGQQDRKLGAGTANKAARALLTPQLITRSLNSSQDYIRQMACPMLNGKERGLKQRRSTSP